MANWFEKDPSAVLDYQWDWSDWLSEEETINTATVTAPTGLTVDSSSITGAGTTVTAWLSGGTAGQTYQVVNHIVTSDGREDDRMITIVVKER